MPIQHQAQERRPSPADHADSADPHRHAQLAADAPSDGDTDTAYLGTTLNSEAANASVNNITGEVSLKVPLVDRPTCQGLGPRLLIHLVYNSTSGGSAPPMPAYLNAFATGGWTWASPEYPNGWAPALCIGDWDLDLPAIVENGSRWSLRFHGQSWQANLNNKDRSPDKTAFYYAKALENGNKLKLDYANGEDITGGATLTTPDGTRWAITTPTTTGWLLTSIRSPNGSSLHFSYAGQGTDSNGIPRQGRLSVTDADGKTIYSLISDTPVPQNPDSPVAVGTMVPTTLYGASCDAATVSPANYDTYALLGSRGGVTRTGVSLYPRLPTSYDYADVEVGHVLYTKLSRIIDPTGAYAQINWLAGGFVVRYGVVHVTSPDDSDISHTFSYAFAPADTHALFDADGNQVWSKQYYYSQDQAEGISDGADDGSATYQCPNMWEFDTNEMADGVAPSNNWLDPLFNSTEHHHHNDDTPGTSYTTGNVSLRIAAQSFSVYEITTYPDGSAYQVMQTYDCLQRLASVQVTRQGSMLSQTVYSYPVTVAELGIGNAYQSYRQLPAHFDQPTRVERTAAALFNGRVWSGGKSLSTVLTYAYDAGGNQTMGESASGVTQTFAYADGFDLPCKVNPYVTAATSKPSDHGAMGGVSFQPAQYLDADGSLQPVSANTNSTAYAEVDGCIRPSSMTSRVSGQPGPLTRGYSYDASGRVSSITEQGSGFSTTRNLSYSSDPQGNLHISAATSYGRDEDGPTLPSIRVIDALGRTVSKTDARGRVTTYQYDALGRLTRKTGLANLPKAQQLVTAYDYALDQGGSSVTMTTPFGAKVSYRFDSLGRQTDNRIQGVGDDAPRTVRSFSYGNTTADGGTCCGQLVRAVTHIAPGASTATSYFYNAMGDQVAAIPAVGTGHVSLPFNSGHYSYVLGLTCTWSNSAGISLHGRASLVQSCAITGVTIASYVFDAALVNLSPGSGANATLDGILSDPGLVANLIDDDFGVDTAKLTPAQVAVTTEYAYDNLYRLVGETLSGNGRRWAMNRVYDRNGRIAQMTDPAGRQWAMRYDPRGNSTELQLTAGDGQPTYSLARARCDAAGRKISWSNLASIADAPTPPPATSYSYDATSGVIISQTDGLGHELNYLWYPSGALAAMYSQADSGWYLWSALNYDDHGAILSNRCGPIADEPTLSNLSPSSADAGYTYAYDADGRLTAKTVEYAGQPPQTTTYGYDAWGNNTQFNDKLWQCISVTLDAHGRKAKLSDAVGNALSYSYDDLGRPATLTRSYPGAVTVNWVQTYGYDALLRTTSLTGTLQIAGNAVPASGLITGFSQRLSYDFWDNIVGNAVSIEGHDLPTDTLSQSYGYDAAERLVSYNVVPDSTLYPRAADGSALSAMSFSYDLFDNIVRTVTTPTTGGPVTAAYSYASDGPFLLTEVTPGSGQTAQSIAYDRLQRTTTDSHGSRIAYDALGRVTSMTLADGRSVSYGYGPGNEAIRQRYSDGADIRTFYAGRRVIGRQDDSSAPVRTPLGFGDNSTITTHDLLGNPVLSRTLTVDIPDWMPPQPYPQGSVGNRLHAKRLFGPTGVQTNYAGADPTSGYPTNLQPAAGASISLADLPDGGLGYNDAITDPITGDQLLGSYRAYDPTLGRFISPDSASPGAGLNPYAYTGNRFIGASDPSGHYSYTYKSYHKAIKAIEAASRRHHDFWHQLVANYENVVMNVIKHPGNINSWVAAATTCYNPMGPLYAAVSDQLRTAGPVGQVFSGVYDGIQSFAMGTATLGFATYNPQTGSAGLQTAGVGNMLGMLSLGYVDLAPNGMPELHAGHAFGTHAARWGKALGDLPESIASDMAMVPIGLLYDMPMDFATGQYYLAGVALGYNGAALAAMLAAPEDAAEISLTDDADLTGVADLFKEPGDDYYFGDTAPERPGFFEGFAEGFRKGLREDLPERKGRGGAASEISEAAAGGGRSAPREAGPGAFGNRCGDYLGTEIAKGLINPRAYADLNVHDPRSPWSTAAWQTMLYRQGPYRPKEK